MPDELDIRNPYNTLETDYEAGQQLPAPTQSQRAKPVLNAAVGVLRLSIVLLLGLVILSAVSDTASQLENGGLTVKILHNPQPGETIQLDNTTFEFDGGNGVSSDNVAIPIGATVEETADNMVIVFGQYNYNSVVA